MKRSELDGILAGLRDGRLREIGPKISKLDAGQARAVSKQVCGQLEQAVSIGGLDHTHRWLVTALQFLAPSSAGDLVTQALRRSIHLRNCCGCVRNRLMRTAGAIGSPQAIPALVEVICDVDNPAHKQLAAVCMGKIVKPRGPEGVQLLRDQVPRLRRELDRLRRALATTRQTTPPKPWIHLPGSPRWCAAGRRAIKAIERLLPACVL